MVACPGTGSPYDCLIRMTAHHEDTSFTIESATETRQGNIDAINTHTEVFENSQRVTSGLETVGLFITSDFPISVHIDQPNWELDVAMARPVDAADVEYYVTSYLYTESTTSSFRPLSFYSIAASEDDTNVQVLDNDRRVIVDFVMNKFDVWTEDADDLGAQGADVDYTGVYVTSDKPVSVFGGHGRVHFPDNNNNNYVYDCMPSTGELGTMHTTFPILFGPDDNGYVVRVVAVSDDTTVTIASLGVSEVVNAGHYYELEHRVNKEALKVSGSKAE